MHNVHQDAGKRRTLRTRAGLRRAVTVGGTLMGAALITAAFSLPAGATQVPPANNTLIGTGSSTTYSMMQSLDLLFNSSPGCQQFVPFPSTTTLQPLDYSCTGPQTIAPGAENPFNDISVQEPALGSSNGVRALEDQGPHGATSPSGGTDIGNVATNENYARSSRALGSSDLKGLNFVAYAEDGVTWFHYKSIGGTAAGSGTTPSNGVTNLTQAQLAAIYNGTDTNWDQVGGANAPIVVFSAQEGSGTQSTWKTFLGFDPSAATNQVNCYTPSGGSKTCVGPAVIFENEDAQITTKAFTTSQAKFIGPKNPAWLSQFGTSLATPNEVKSDSIFFFSAGKYNVQCKANVHDCGGSPLGATTNAIESIGGVAPTEQNILDGQFSDDRYLYNVYSNGSNANIPAATAATVNYVSEIGFMCNPNKGSGTATLDPNTGATYLSEVQADITNAGFYPLSAGAASGTVNQSPIDEGTVPNPASALLNDSGGQGQGQTASDNGYAQYKPFDTFATTGPNNDPSGFCLTTDTDSNANS